MTQAAVARAFLRYGRIPERRRSDGQGHAV